MVAVEVGVHFDVHTELTAYPLVHVASGPRRAKGGTDGLDMRCQQPPLCGQLAVAVWTESAG